MAQNPPTTDRRVWCEEVLCCCLCCAGYAVSGMLQCCLGATIPGRPTTARSPRSPMTFPCQQYRAFCPLCPAPEPTVRGFLPSLPCARANSTKLFALSALLPGQQYKAFCPLCTAPVPTVRSFLPSLPCPPHHPHAALATQISMLQLLHWPHRSACSNYCTGHTDQHVPAAALATRMSMPQLLHWPHRSA